MVESEGKAVILKMVDGKFTLEVVLSPLFTAIVRPDGITFSCGSISMSSPTADEAYFIVHFTNIITIVVLNNF